MRLLAPLMFVLIGLLVAALFTALFRGHSPGFRINALLGVAGAFVGLWVRDLLDIMDGGPLLGALVAALAGAVVFTGVANLLGLFRRPR